MKKIVAIRRNAKVVFTDGSVMELVEVNATKAQMHKHYNAFCRNWKLKARVKKVEFS